jgi:hypothetical protein
MRRYNMGDMADMALEEVLDDEEAKLDYILGLRH